MRSRGLALVSVVLLVSACGGGSKGPTEPAPAPTPTAPVPLEGSWSGTLTITAPSPVTCTLSLTLANGPDYIGDWEAQCSDGKQGRGFTFANAVLADQVLVAGLQGAPVFGGCGWASLATRTGNRLQGDWSTPQNCQTGPFLQSRMALTKK